MWHKNGQTFGSKKITQSQYKNGRHSKWSRKEASAEYDQEMLHSQITDQTMPP